MLRLNTPWQELNTSTVAAVGGWLGVYELRSQEGETVRMGYAGGRSLFGLRGELEAQLERYGPGSTWFRYEVTSAYWSRYRELLMLHVHDHGSLPRDNDDDPSRLGRLSPA